MDDRSKLISEIMDESDAELTGIAQAFVRDGSVILKSGDENIIDDDYSIELSSCKTPERVLAWVNHLSDKNWVTPKLLSLFIDRACTANGINVPRL